MSGKNMLYLVSLLSIYILAWILQTNLFLNWDVSQLLQVTRFMMDGGRYGIDYLTPNPPMILYLSVIPLLASQLFSISIVLTFQLYVFVLATISLCFCSVLIKKIVDPADGFIAYIFLMSLALAFLIVPAYNFGQRDHLLVIFSMPYFLVVVSRLQGRDVGVGLAVVVGLFASLGFSLKPHFLITLFLIEAYYTFCKKNLLASVRPETVSLFSVIAVYSITTWIFYPEFFQLIVPFIAKYYIDSLSVPWIDLMLSQSTIFSLLVILIYLLTLKNEAYHTLTSVLCVVLASFMLTYILQRSSLIYHEVPQLSLSIIMVVLWACILFKNYHSYVFMLIALLLLVMPIRFIYEIYHFGDYYKTNYLKPMISFVNNLPAPHKMIYVVGQPGWFGVPLVDYTNTTYVQTIDSFWVAADLVKKLNKYGDIAARRYIQRNDDPMFFLNIVASDFSRYKPDFVFVDVSEKNYSVNGKMAHFNYLDYFLENSLFKNEWSHYVNYTMVDLSFQDTRIQVYRRMPGKL